MMSKIYIVLLLGMASFGESHRAVMSNDLPKIDTSEILEKLAGRRLQMNVESPLTMDIEIDTMDLEVANGSPANGCTICQGNTLLPDKIPNQSLFPEFADATCQQWQDVILPEIAPNGDDCPNHQWYQMLFVSCCQLPLSRYQCEQNVHDLHASSSYNTRVPPIESQEAPLDVSTELVFDWMDKLVVEQGTATLHLTLHLKWKDPRLAWTVNDTTCANYISVGTAYDDDTSIWIPDFGLLNGVENFRSSPTRDALVFSDGTVIWQTGGTTTATCQYHGLADIPFDRLGCQFIYGHRSRTDANAIRFRHENYNAIRLRNFNAEYSEFIPVPELFEKGYTWYQNTDHSSALYYNFFFCRSTNFYVVNILIPTIIFTYCGFFAFLLDMRIGERLGYSMALALVVIAHQIVTVGMIPRSARTLWINKFIAWSFYWVMFALVQSVFVGFIYYLNEDYEQHKRESQAIMASMDNGSVHSNSSKGVANPVKKQPSESAASNGSDSDDGSSTGSNGVANPTKNVVWHKKPFYYICSTRKFDYICMALCFLSYTIFIIAMVTAVRSKGWSQQEAEWDDYNSNFFWIEYENKVWNPWLQ